jgi:hypothetical protein
MNSATEVNRELTRLDVELRAGGIDRSMFRSKRRKLLLDFEERQTTTTPGVLTGNEVTLVDPPAEMPLHLPASTPEAASSRSTPPGTTPTRRPALGIAVLVIGILVVLALVGWWALKPKPTVATTGAPAPTSVAAPPIAGADTPQSIASALLATEWTDADVSDFLQHWRQLSPEAIKSATEDSRIWLLRGETGRRLREAREAESVEHSAELQVRVHQLEQLQETIRSP